MINLNDANFEEKVNSTDKYVLVDFFATWCEPCSVLGPILEKIEGQFKDNLIVMKANVDETPITSQKFSVDRIPMVALFKNGKQINGFTGLIPEKKIKEWLENIISDKK